MEGFDDSVFEVASENEAAVPRELFHKVTECWLSRVCVEIICFVQDTFFRLDRALESYQKIEKAALENRIRLENEHKRDILNKTNLS